MNANSLLIGIISIVIFLLVGTYFWNLQEVDNAISFADVEINLDSSAIDQIAKGYITLPSITADEEAISDLIGAIAVRTRNTNTEDWSYNLKFRPARDKIRTRIVDEELFHGIVTVNADFGGRFNIVSGSVAAEDLAEASIRNQLIVGYKDSADIPFKELSKIKFSPDKDYYFVTSVVVTDITTRRFRKHSGEGKIDGMAFGANGVVYAERDAMQRQKVVSFLPISPIDLQVSEAGGSTELTQLASKSRLGRISRNEANTLLKILKESAIDIAPNKIPLEAPQGILPEALRALEPIVWIDDLRPIRQSTENRCWAATTAMLFSWKKKRLVSELEAVSSLGYAWEELFERDSALPSSYKPGFLQAAGFSYSAPQSYMAEGLVSLLKNNGPAWFTIAKDFSRHATILTGVFLDRKNNEYWVSYVDPTDGTLKADTYISFMNRYEAPAGRANDEGIEVAMTFEDLDIQVIHW